MKHGAVKQSTINQGALRSRDFRLFWMALIVSAIGTWMQIVAQSLLVLQLAHGNAAALGLVALAQAAAFFLFALFGGGVADRMDRRRLLLLTQTLLMTIALLIGALVAMQAARVWMIVVAAFVSGSILSIDQPARAAFLPALVAERDLANAVALQTSVFTGAAALAPLLAGLAIARFGLAGNFFWNAASYLVVIGVLLLLRPQAAAVSAGTRASGTMWKAVQDGLSTVRRDHALRWALSGYALLLFAAPSMQILLPVLVERVLHAYSGALGLLFAAFGLGSILGALLIPRLLAAWRADAVYFSCFAVWIGALALLAATKQMSVYLVALLLLGAAQGALGTLMVTLLQARVERSMRGRVMSVQTLLNMGVRPLGDFPLSFLIVFLGARQTAGVSAALIASYVVYLAIAKHDLLLAGQPRTNG